MESHFCEIYKGKWVYLLTDIFHLKRGEFSFTCWLKWKMTDATILLCEQEVRKSMLVQVNLLPLHFWA